MNDTWKPGDVAAMNLMNRDIRIFCYKDLDTGDVEWMSVDQGGAYPGPLHPARRLIVIDPEDREQVERLLASLERMSFSTWACGALTCLQGALREFANPTPPKPEEPTGLGAVVADAHGLLWTRVESGEAITRNPWYPAGNPDVQPDEWDRIKAVRVLSEGVTP